MEWTLKFDPPKADIAIEAAAPLYMAGSCFAQHWGKHLESLRWPGTYHPLHITYQPEALLRQLSLTIHDQPLIEEHWVEVEGIWRHFDVHSHFGHPVLELARQQIERNKQLAQSSLEEAEYCMITLGTSLVFEYQKTGLSVANCQKVPQSEFQFQQLSVDQIGDQLLQIQQLLEGLPRMKAVVWTVSPVRHHRSGLVENQRSKSHLIAAVHQLVSQHQRAVYFPAYEWMMDVLRDYRFYKSDKVHPTEEAVQFIFKQFIKGYFDSSAQELYAQLRQVQRMRNHRPQFKGTAPHKKFVQQREAIEKRIRDQYPLLSLD